MTTNYTKTSELKEVSLLEAFKLSGLDLTKLVYLPLGGINLDYAGFDISPMEFLRYAKDDFQLKTQQGLVNSLSNAKRAIDCQIDVVIASLYMDWLKLPKSLEKFISCFEFDNDISYKLKVIQALNLAPSLLISEARSLRHALEHNYKIPDEIGVKRAIDIADLFIRSIDGVFNSRCNELELTDENNVADENSDSSSLNCLEISFAGVLAESGTILIRVMNVIEGVHTTIAKVVLTPNDPLFFAVYRLVFSEGDGFELTESVRIIAKLAGHPMPLEHIHVD